MLSRIYYMSNTSAGGAEKQRTSLLRPIKDSLPDHGLLRPATVTNFPIVWLCRE